jgi:hypothetical protein
MHQNQIVSREGCIAVRKRHSLKGKETPSAVS